MSVVLGCIADDFTGATDLASTLVTAGMRTVQVIGVPPAAWGAAGGGLPGGGPRVDFSGYDAVVVALASRAMPAAEAVRDSLAALEWLKALGVRQTYFKYCSTFDSSDAGNIGPVADGLLGGLGTDFTVICPAFPDNKRTVYQGHLFVGDRLLSESSMRHHPLTPMTDSDLVRVLRYQTARQVGLIPLAVVRAGAAAIRAEVMRLRAGGISYGVVDAITNDDLQIIGEACVGLPLVTGASGLARGLPANFVAAGLLAALQDGATMPRVSGTSAVLAGSCSEATRRQVAQWASDRPAVMIDPLAGPADPVALAAAALAKADSLTATKRTAVAGDADVHVDMPVLFYSSASPQDVAVAQAALGHQAAATLMEKTFARLASELVRRGVRRLVVAGGETSGAVVKALHVQALSIGPAIAPGVPWTITVGDAAAPRLALALKSGNFGGVDFFGRALEMLS